MQNSVNNMMIFDKISTEGDHPEAYFNINKEIIKLNKEDSNQHQSVFYDEVAYNKVNETVEACGYEKISMFKFQHIISSTDTGEVFFISKFVKDTCERILKENGYEIFPENDYIIEFNDKDYILILTLISFDC